jgi:hypothetical protein
MFNSWAADAAVTAATAAATAAQSYSVSLKVHYAQNEMIFSFFM